MGKYLPLDGGEAALEVPAPRWVAEVALENASFILSVFLTDVFSSDLFYPEHHNWFNSFHCRYIQQQTQWFGLAVIWFDFALWDLVY